MSLERLLETAPRRVFLRRILGDGFCGGSFELDRQLHVDFLRADSNAALAARAS
jgi:hypothetical protein